MAGVWRGRGRSFRMVVGVVGLRRKSRQRTQVVRLQVQHATAKQRMRDFDNVGIYGSPSQGVVGYSILTFLSHRHVFYLLVQRFMAADALFLRKPDRYLNRST